MRTSEDEDRLKTARSVLQTPDLKHIFLFQKITILRDPFDNFVSSYKYYNGMYKDLRKSLPYYTDNKEHEFVEGKGTSKIESNINLKFQSF